MYEAGCLVVLYVQGFEGEPDRYEVARVTRVGMKTVSLTAAQDIDADSFIQDHLRYHFTHIKPYTPDLYHTLKSGVLTTATLATLMTASRKTTRRVFQQSEKGLLDGTKLTP